MSALINTVQVLVIPSVQPCCSNCSQLCKPRAIPKLALQLPQAELSIPSLMPCLSLECRLDLQRHPNHQELRRQRNRAWKFVCEGDARVLIRKGPAVWSAGVQNWGCPGPQVSHWSLQHPYPSGKAEIKPGASAALSSCQTPGWVTAL